MPQPGPQSIPIPFPGRLLLKHLAAFGEMAFSHSRVFALFLELKEGRKSIKDECGKSARPSVRAEDNIKFVEALINEDRHRTIQDLASESRLSTASVHLILHQDLGLSKKAARRLPRFLSDKHKVKQVKIV